MYPNGQDMAAVEYMYRMQRRGESEQVYCQYVMNAFSEYY
jgi:hypothetical protein